MNPQVPVGSAGGPGDRGGDRDTISESLQIGLGVFTGQIPAGSGRTAGDEYRDMLDLAQVAEEAGFDALWVSEHHGVDDGYLPSLNVALAAVAAVTERLKLGMAVALAPLQHPIRFAEDCAVVDLLSGGRLIVGLGIGWRGEEFRAFDVPKSERVGRTIDLVNFCRLAWQGERFSFEGRHFNAHDVAVTPAPEQSIPIMLGGAAPAALTRAGNLADGFIASPHNDLPTYRRQVEAFDAAADASGRSERPLPVGFHVNAWVSSDGVFPEHVRRAIWSQMGKYLELHHIDDGLPLDAFPPVDDELIDARSIIGDPSLVLESFLPWVSGFGAGREQHVIVRLHHPGLALDEAATAVRLFGEQVIPVLRQSARLQP